ncbi:hypothetical protein BVG16_13390 [Paenibacillus selenitireducens]|uniref:Uncharacterized protein n=1 Tax=Paenibacillus selenitireducens TaxID=1324314 RepID=A0A1T2XC16_9BACL|nr:hypothetical protein [Paenibacillus selenitireducens]OPA77447.1 hypothetical protein BVG16_13390 [Paenibacillus selenitireducens]
MEISEITLVSSESQTSKFEWVNRIGCVELIANLCVDSDLKFDEAIGRVQLGRYCSNPLKMTKKQQSMLKRDFVNKVKDIHHERMVPEVGDTVRVAKLIPNKFFSGYIQESKTIVEAVVVAVRKMSNGNHYRVKRIQDGEMQEGNGHMIKGILSKGNQEVIGLEAQ